MPTVVVSAYNVAAFPEGAGHLWVYLQYVLGLRQLGCDVYWLERFRPGRNRSGVTPQRAAYSRRLGT